MKFLSSFIRKHFWTNKNPKQAAKFISDVRKVEKPVITVNKFVLYRNNIKIKNSSITLILNLN